MKKLILFFLLSLTLLQRPAAQTLTFVDTLDMIARSWKLVSAEGARDTSIHLELLVGRTIRFRRDFTYTTLLGDSIIEQGAWALDREKKWLMSMPDRKMTSICGIGKLTALEWKLFIEINDDKIWLTMIPSDHN